MKPNCRIVSLFHSLGVAALLLTTLATRADELQLLWQISPADALPYLGTGNNERGVAYNPVTSHVLLVSRSDNEIHIFDLAGAEVGTLARGDIIAGGTFTTSLIGVADDGAIYVANLTTGSGTTPFKVYRWASETAEGPTLAYEGDPGAGDTTAVRWGDSFDVRGSGANTQLAAAAGGATGTAGAIFTTTDGLTFTATKISNFAANFVAFGSGNRIWTKRSGFALRHIAFNLSTGEGTLLALPATTVPTTLIGIAVDPTNNLLAGINFIGGTDEFRLYDISNTNNFLIIDQEVFPADNANGNAAGSSDVSGDVVVSLDTNNGLMVFRIIETVTPVSFVGQPASLTLVEGAAGTLSGSVSGTAPISLQWQFNGTAVPGQTNSAIALTNVTFAQDGAYTLLASNAAGSLTSAPAVLTVVARAERASVLWRLAPGSRPYLQAGNTERGIAYNKISNRVLLVSRTGDVNIHVLDGDTGADLWTLQAPADIVAGSVPAGFRLNMVGVADDGVVYAANLDTPSGASYQIYRWENDSSNSLPTIAWSGAPVPDRRFGDTMDVRGAGANTQILLASQNTATTDDNVAVVMTTTDGLAFTPNPITTAGLNDDYLRLGIAFGSGNTFWGKTAGQALYQVQFDTAAGTGTIVQTYTNATASSTAVGVHPSSNLVAMVALETPDNLRIYDLNPTTQELTLVDQEYFATDNPNANGTGSVDFGNDRLYAIDTNNGILALKLAGGSSGTPPQFTVLSRTPTSVTFRVGHRPTAVRIESTTDFSTWTTVQTLQANETDFTVNTEGIHRFYRAVEQ